MRGQRRREFALIQHHQARTDPWDHTSCYRVIGNTYDLRTLRPDGETRDRRRPSQGFCQRGAAVSGIVTYRFSVVVQTSREPLCRTRLDPCRVTSVWLSDIAQSCDRIQQYIAGMDRDAFLLDQKTIDAVTRNLEIIGEAGKHLPEDVRARESTIEWRKIAGLRDILIHAYHGVDPDIVWSASTTKLPALRQAIASLLSTQSP